jgi:hypothetical protein
MIISTTIRRRYDDITDTVWDVCPFCRAEIKDETYRGNGLYDDAIIGLGGIYLHLAAEHGVQRVRKGKRQVWKDLSPEDQARAKEWLDQWLKTWGQGSIKRVSDYYPRRRPDAAAAAE